MLAISEEEWHRGAEVSDAFPADVVDVPSSSMSWSLGEGDAEPEGTADSSTNDLVLMGEFDVPDSSTSMEEDVSSDFQLTYREQALLSTMDAPQQEQEAINDDSVSAVPSSSLLTELRSSHDPSSSSDHDIDALPSGQPQRPIINGSSSILETTSNPHSPSSSSTATNQPFTLPTLSRYTSLPDDAFFSSSPTSWPTDPIPKSDEFDFQSKLLLAPTTNSALVQDVEVAYATISLSEVPPPIAKNGTSGKGETNFVQHDHKDEQEVQAIVEESEAARDIVEDPTMVRSSQKSRKDGGEVVQARRSKVKIELVVTVSSRHPRRSSTNSEINYAPPKPIEDTEDDFVSSRKATSSSSKPSTKLTSFLSSREQVLPSTKKEEAASKRNGNHDFDATSSPPKKIRPSVRRVMTEAKYAVSENESDDPIDLLAMSPVGKSTRQPSALVASSLASSSTLPKLSLTIEANRPKRSPIRVAYREVSQGASGDDEEEGDDEFVANEGVATLAKKLKSKKKKASTTKPATVVKLKLPKKIVGAVEKATGKVKGKGKKGKEKEKVKIDLPIGKRLVKKVSHGGHLPSMLSPTSSQGLPPSAPPESQEHRAADWNLNGMIDFVWVLVKGEDESSTPYEFWWPARIQSVLRDERPLKLSLINSHLVSTFSSPTILLDRPSSLNILSLDSTRDKNRRTRFDSITFAVLDPDTSIAPSAVDFDIALRAVLVESMNQESSDEVPTEKEEEDEEEEEEEEEEAKDEDHSDAELMRDDKINDATGFEFPCVTLVLWTYGTYWPATVLGFDEEASLFDVCFADRKKTRVARSKILRLQDPDFYTCKMGNSEAVVDIKALLLFLRASSATFHEIILNTHRPSKEWNSVFFSDKKTRLGMSNRARYGVFSETNLVKISEVLTEWIEGPSEAKRCKGSDAYEQLDSFNRTNYVSLVLLPLAIILWTAEEIRIEDLDDEEEEDASLAMSAQELAAEHWRKAQEELDEPNIVAFVTAARQTALLGAKANATRAKEREEVEKEDATMKKMMQKQKSKVKKKASLS